MQVTVVPNNNDNVHLNPVLKLPQNPKCWDTFKHYLTKLA